MRDLIDRQTALSESYHVVKDGEVFEVVQVETILGLPTVQPEILKCMDCIYSKICTWRKAGATFCSFAEGRE